MFFCLVGLFMALIIQSIECLTTKSIQAAPFLYSPSISLVVLLFLRKYLRPANTKSFAQTMDMSRDLPSDVVAFPKDACDKPICCATMTRVISVVVNNLLKGGHIG